MFKFLKRINEYLRQFRSNKKDPVFIFPYSADPAEKRSQVWANLQKGILLEDKGILIPWGTPDDEIDQLKESRKIRSDRTEWYLGKRTILGGYESPIEITKWFWKEAHGLTMIDENLGYDEEGEKKFNYIKDYLIELLGDPTKMEIEKFGSLDIGEVCWQNGMISVYIIGIENVNCRYSFHISLTTHQID